MFDFYAAADCQLLATDSQSELTLIYKLQLFSSTILWKSFSKKNLCNMAYFQAYQRKMIGIYSLKDPNRKRTKAPPLNHHMTLGSRGIRGHVYEMRNHKLNSPKTRRFAFTNIVSVTKNFQTPRSVIRRPLPILKTIFLVGLSWHTYRVYIQQRRYHDIFSNCRMKNLNDITLILCNPK